jgi:signal transduction histidine kinase
VAIAVELDPAHAEIFADALAMRGAFVNLAMNAIEAMGPGGTLTVAARAADGPSEEVRVSFRDTGPGLPEELREKVFAPFYSTKPTGIGLGLALVQKTMADHGGRIQVRSRAGVGTEFVIHLPKAEAGSTVGARA